jgi:hypothetical protein
VWWSSFDIRAGGSRNLGDGSRRGVLSDSDRVFVLGVRTSSGLIEPSSTCPCGSVMFVVAWLVPAVSGAIAARALNMAKREVLIDDYAVALDGVRSYPLLRE